MLWQNLLSVGQHDQVLLAIRDDEVPIFINPAYIAGVKPSIRFYGFSRLLEPLIVTLHNVWTAYQYLSVISESYFDPIKRSTHCTKFDFSGRIHSHKR